MNASTGATSSDGTAAPQPRSAPGCPVVHRMPHGKDPKKDPKGAPAASWTQAQQTSSDEGYFGRDSVSRRVYSDPSSRLGGAAGLLLQSLNPMMMRVFAGTSDYASDVEGRAERTDRYIETTIFGDRAHADAAAEAVRRLHANTVWTDPKTGERLRADTQEWLAWTHNTLVYCMLRAAEAFGPVLTAEDQDRFVSEQHEAARLVGITERELLPRSGAELAAYIDENKAWMALTLPAAEVTRGMRRPSLRGNPIAVFVAVNVQDAVLSLLPDWALLLFGIEGRPMSLRAAAKTTRRVIAIARRRRSTDVLIAEATERARTHPYRRVRPRRPQP